MLLQVRVLSISPERTGALDISDNFGLDNTYRILTDAALGCRLGSVLGRAP
jgi:hypothetical protein